MRCNPRQDPAAHSLSARRRGAGKPGRRAVWLLALCLGLLFGGVLAGWGHTADPAHGIEDAAARAAVHALSAVPAGADTHADTDARIDAGRAAVPAGFAKALGYRPVSESTGGRTELVNPGGGCSSPFGSTVFDFDLACKHHDLGYDMLRLAADRGAPLGEWARDDLDARFGADLHARCEQVGPLASARGAACRLTAQVYVGAVELNSWRQGWGAPVVERPAPWLAGGAMGLAVTLLVAWAPTVLGGAAATTTRPTQPTVTSSSYQPTD